MLEQLLRLLPQKQDNFVQRFTAIENKAEEDSIQGSRDSQGATVTRLCQRANDASTS